MSDANYLPDTEEAAQPDLLFPPPPLPAPHLFEGVGESGLHKLVVHHHDLLRQSSIGDLFPRDPKRFAAVVERIANFIVDSSLGRPQGVETLGLVWFRSRHLPLTIDETARNVWLAALLMAYDDLDFPVAARQSLWNWVEAISIRAITRRTMVGQPRRFAFADAPAALRPFIESVRRQPSPPRRG